MLKLVELRVHNDGWANTTTIIGKLCLPMAIQTTVKKPDHIPKTAARQRRGTCHPCGMIATYTRALPLGKGPAGVDKRATSARDKANA